MLYNLGLCAAFALLILSTARCSKDSDIVEVTDYSKPEHWLALPSNPDKPVDIFYLYPTAWTPDSLTEPVYCAIDNPSMISGAAFAYSVQATVFETVGNMYAPFYRQMNATYAQSKTEEERWELADSLPVADAIAAFDYYIRHYNNGRPFILAAHSQGSHVMFFLLSRYMREHLDDVYHRMIAAYSVGYPLTADFLDAIDHLKFAEGPDDTGVIISYNTQSPNVSSGTNIVVGDNIGMVINPINWKRDETLATAAESLGSFMPDSTMINFEKVLNFADARIDLTQGVLICSSMNDSAMYKLSGGMGLGIYHGFDYPFYYFDLRQNAENRVTKYFGK